MDFEGEMVQEDGFVSFEEEPIFYLTDYLFFCLGLLVFLSYGFINILLLTRLLSGIGQLRYLRRFGWSTRSVG